MVDKIDITDVVNWNKYLLIDNPSTGIVKMIKKEEFYKELLIKDFQHWEVYLHESQCYLGRSYIWAKRKDVVDFFDIDKREAKEYFEIGRELKRALKESFKPDLYNYATLANTTPHLHTHIIPRYSSQREFLGVTFKDERWGENYVPYDKYFAISNDILFKIRDEIKAKLR